MKPHYLEHLARRGLADLHPHGAAASAALIAALELQAGQRVLEIGCGTGRSLLRTAGEGVHWVVGVERLPEMLAMARRRIEQSSRPVPVSLIEGTASHLPLAPAVFDRVYTESVLGFQHEAAARQLLAEVWRVLVPGGRYVANEAIWRPHVTAGEARRIYESCLEDFGLCQASPQPWNVDNWRAVMAQAGFQMLSADRIEDCLTNMLAADGQDQETQLPPVLRFKFSIHPRLLWERFHYRRLLSRHQHDGEAMESRLFVLAKP